VLVDRRRRKSRSSAPLFESRFPVGSSAKMISGWTRAPGARDALLLSAGELRRSVAQAVTQTDVSDDLCRTSPVDVAAGDIQRQRDVLARASASGSG
jgi:hypothetical protein